jgi:hypothetical protein
MVNDKGVFEMIRENMDFISQYDPELGATVKEEFARERRNIELIAKSCAQGRENRPNLFI